MNTPRRLPPLSQLRAFEAAARLGSFKRAAQELSVTPAAISHQVKALEEQLGLALFERRTRQVVLTPPGRQLLPALSAGFDTMAEAVAALRAQRQAASVTLSTTRAFMAQWLLPRLAAFRARHPRIELYLHADEAPVDVAAGEADLAIRYGTGPYPGLEATRLLEDRYRGVCSPQLKIRARRQLPQCTLIHFEWQRPWPDAPDWARWHREAGVPSGTSRGLRFSEEVHAIQAAIAGQGVALLSDVLVQEELRRGVLRVPFGPALPGPGYWLLQRPGAGPAARQVARWLMREAARQRVAT